MVEQDYYELLGIARGADDAAIKAAYRRLAKECHPDRHNGCADKEARFKAVNEAYDVLKDPQKRAAWDAPREPRPSQLSQRARASMVMVFEAPL